METENTAVRNEEIEGLDDAGGSWGDYPLDDVRIRRDYRTVFDVMRRIKQGFCVMKPDFQRDFIWKEDKQSKLIESVLMRIPLPVFYMAEDDQGRMIVVDGLQRLATLQRFMEGKLHLRLPKRHDINGKRFDDLLPKFQNRIEDCNLTFYIIDAKAPERARLDIFERVNDGIALTRQQMRNCLYMGKATRFLKEEAQTRIFSEATGGSLKTETMRDREFVNRFCAFRVLGPEAYRRDDMDGFLAECLKTMNEFSDDDIARLRKAFRQGLANNLMLFGKHAFRKRNWRRRQKRRSVLNASFWDVMSTGLSYYPKERVESCAESLRGATEDLLDNRAFNKAITDGTNDTGKVKIRFEKSQAMFKEVLGAHAD